MALKDKQAANEYSKTYAKKNPEKVAENWRIQNAKKYGYIPLPKEEYDAQRRMQDDECIICGGVNESGRKLHQDHHHESGQVRELLCGPCNRGLGIFLEDPDRLRAAADYIEDWNVKRVA